MNGHSEPRSSIVVDTRERISYIKQMLGELSQVARAERAELLVYLLEMAFTEAGDILNNRPQSRHIK